MKKFYTNAYIKNEIRNAVRTNLNITEDVLLTNRKSHKTMKELGATQTDMSNIIMTLESEFNVASVVMKAEYATMDNMFEYFRILI